MAKKVNTVTESLGQYFELAIVFIRKLLSLDLTVTQVKDLIENKRHPFWIAFNEATKILVTPPIVSDEVSRANDTLLQLGFWTRFYKQHLDLDLDLSEVEIPKHQQGFDRLIVVPKGVTLNQIWAVCQKHFGAWRYTDDLDSAVSTNDRDPKNGTYAIWIRDVVEADEEMKNLSANDLKEKQVKGITLLERMIFELKYFSETGKHLDIENWTLCSGSRDADGLVPDAHWLPAFGGFDVRWTHCGFRNSGLRSRVVVTL